MKAYTNPSYADQLAELVRQTGSSVLSALHDVNSTVLVHVAASGELTRRRRRTLLGSCLAEGRLEMDADRSIMRGTGAGLLEFCDRAGERGDMTRETARGYRIASGKILAIESDDLDSIDLRGLDVDNLLDRFAKLSKADFSAGSLATYRSRFRLAVPMYLAWLDDDPNWKTAGRDARPRERGTARAASPRPTGRTRFLQPSASRTTVSQADKPEPADDAPSGVRLLTYDVPLRPDLIVRITLPLDLTEADADRLTAFVRSLAFSGRAPSGPEIRPVKGAG